MKTLNKSNLSSCCDCFSLNCSRSPENLPRECITKKIPLDALSSVTDYYQKNKSVEKVMQAAAEIEGQFYGQLTRVEETVEFIKRMNYSKIGIVSCVGLAEETRAFSQVLTHHDIQHYGVLCKIGAIDKSRVGILNSNRVHPESKHESMCNPVMQAEVLNELQTDFNIVIGLCVGHDTLFSMHSKAPLTTLIVKDRVTCHNPAAPLHHIKGYYKQLLK